MNWLLTALGKYATFSGRAQRAEYWYFFLFYLLVFFGLAIIDGVTGTYNDKLGFGLLGALFALALVLPSVSLSVRRLHDTGRSGWWLLVGLVPLVGLIVLFFFYMQDSEAGENAYGPNPKTNVT